MTPHPFPNWTNIGSSAEFSDPTTCAKRASKFARMVSIRNGIEYAAGALVFVLFSGAAILAVMRSEFMIALSMAMVVAGIVVVVWNLKRRASNLVQKPEDACLVHLKRQYQHQYKALRSVPMWYVGPFVPGLALFYGAITYNAAQVIGVEAALRGLAQYGGITVGLFAIIILANIVAARSLKRQIAIFDALG